jgi:hypothetical protein
MLTWRAREWIWGKARGWPAGLQETPHGTRRIIAWRDLPPIFTVSGELLPDLRRFLPPPKVWFLWADVTRLNLSIAYPVTWRGIWWPLLVVGIRGLYGGEARLLWLVARTVGHRVPAGNIPRWREMGRWSWAVGVKR